MIGIFRTPILKDFIAGCCSPLLSSVNGGLSLHITSSGGCLCPALGSVTENPAILHLKGISVWIETAAHKQNPLKETPSTSASSLSQQGRFGSSCCWNPHINPSLRSSLAPGLNTCTTCNMNLSTGGSDWFRSICPNYGLDNVAFLWEV